MSQSLEDSPVSDNKMDISETTTSQESPGFSPDADETSNRPKTLNNITDFFNDTKVDKIQTSTPMISTATTTTTTSSDRSTSYTNGHNEDDKEKQQQEIVDKYLDNRRNNENNLVNSENMNLKPNQQRGSGLTPVNSHPLMLMSPTGSESDSSELCNLNKNEKPRNYYQYPDVVPVSEQPLRLANPYPNKIHLDDELMTTTSTKTTSTLDVIHNIEKSNKLKKKVIPVLRESSPDFLSSDSEQDLSQFQAAVAPSFQSVALVSNAGTQMPSFHHKSISPKLHQRRKIPLSTDLLTDDISSLEETLSNHSIDDLQQNLVSLSPSSSILDDNGFNIDLDDEMLDTPSTPKSIQQLPQYSAREEARDIRNWQKITLPDGKTREIDMKVIEPYKCVLSHGGYLKSGGHNAIVVFSACHLPDRSRADYHYVMNNLFLYVVKTLEQLVTEDYVLVYLHGGSSRGNVPPFPWLKKCYQLLDRRLRKSLKHLYMVHPTFWLKSVVWMARPFISSKFWRKLIYVKTLEELYKLVPVEKAAVPDKVKNYDSRHS